jgi:sugar phosphate isomerase/epimerase
MVKVALQLNSFRGVEKKDILVNMEKLAAMGYDGVEFCGFFGYSAKEVKNALTATGLRCSGSHASLNDLQENSEKIIEFNAEIGAPCVVCPRVPEEMSSSADAYKKTAEAFNAIGEKCRRGGLKFAFHHHGVELEQWGGESGLDILCRHTRPDLFYLQVEIYWLACGGFNPADFINKYKGRCLNLHLSDVKSIESRTFTEIGKGVVDMKAIVAACKKNDIEWLNVEQEYYEIPELQSFQESLKYLRSIL